MADDSLNSSGMLLSRGTLASLRDFSTEKGKRYTPYKVESLAVHALAENLERLVNLGYQSVLSINDDLILDLGSQQMLWRYMHLPVTDVDENMRVEIAKRAFELYDGKIPYDQLNRMLSIGSKYINMGTLCKYNQARMSVYEYTGSMPVHDVVGILMKGIHCAALHTEQPSIVRSFVDFVNQGRGSLPVEYLLDVDEKKMVFNAPHGNMAIFVVGKVAEDEFVRYTDELRENPNLVAVIDVPKPEDDMHSFTDIYEEEFVHQSTDVKYPPRLPHPIIPGNLPLAKPEEGIILLDKPKKR